MAKEFYRILKLYLCGTGILCLGIFLFGCRSQNKINTAVSTKVDSVQFDRNIRQNDTLNNTFSENIVTDDHFQISIEPIEVNQPLSESTVVLKKMDSTLLVSEKKVREGLLLELEQFGHLEDNRKVANRIVEDYLNSNKKQPGGHCLTVSKTRFEKAYESVHGHPIYEDLPDSMATDYYTPSEVFHNLYVSAQGTHEGWRTLPIKYRGKGNAGAIAYAGMGTLVDWFGIWSGELQPGALMQVWKRRKDYELVVKGVNNKNFDPFGHSFIFLGYECDEKNQIMGIRIADQGYQSYRPLLPSDYEVWWAVNLNI